MANVANSETDEISKTQFILSLLAEQGPKTEYDLYKQLPKLSHGTIHFCLNKLTQSGSITYTQNKPKNKQTKKLYHLTFIGTVTHIASYLYWQTKELTDSQIEERWKNFEEEEQTEVMEFLYKQGKLLKYALFEESKWLAEHYSGIASIFVIIAHTICQDPPQPYRNLITVAAVSASRKKGSEFTGEKASEEKMPSKEDLIELLQDAYRREFTRLFFELIVFMKHNDKATANLRLRRLAEEELEEKRHETAGLELAIQLFTKQTKQK
jgi:DNA-binding PadR family transcriptional regulator